MHELLIIGASMQERWGGADKAASSRISQLTPDF
jgi:ABC-type cobalt transport system substrate-binding protein